MFLTLSPFLSLNISSEGGFKKKQKQTVIFYLWPTACRARLAYADHAEDSLQCCWDSGTLGLACIHLSRRSPFCCTPTTTWPVFSAQAQMCPFSLSCISLWPSASRTTAQPQPQSRPSSTITGGGLQALPLSPHRPCWSLSWQPQ